jgi:hypothetical protein
VQNKLAYNIKKLIKQNIHYVLKSQIIKSDLRTHNLRLYPKHQITQMAFTLELIPKLEYSSMLTQLIIKLIVT